MNQYFEQMILSASPVEVINLLYQKAIRAVRDAREHLLAGQIAERSAMVSSALAVVSELASSLDFDAAPELLTTLGEGWAGILEAEKQQHAQSAWSQSTAEGEAVRYAVSV
jgi:flagellin-specific chaperone FliS